jgi:hypothetical protein
MITVFFSCRTCGLVDAELRVKPRLPDQLSSDWIKNVLCPALALRHNTLSLMCENKHLTKVKVPYPKDGVIGDDNDLIPPKETEEVK